MIPKCGADAVVSGREFMVVFVMLEQRQRQVIRTKVRTMMHKQIPGIGSQGARKERTAGNQIDERKTDPDLPEKSPDRFIGVCVMHSVLFGHKLVEYEPMKNIFGKGPRDDTRDEKLRSGSHSERGHRQQNDCQQRRNEDFAEIEDGGHAPV